MEKWLDSECEIGTCSGKYCGDAVRTDGAGNWFITIGHPGFNSPSNNRSGYSSKAKAEAALRRYTNVARAHGARGQAVSL